MKLGVVGSRSYNNYGKIKLIVGKYVAHYKEVTIVSGGCPKGADKWAKEIALELGLKYEEFPPIHDRHNIYCVPGPENYGKPYHVRNFFSRNKLIAEYCDHLIAFVINGIKANGTMDTVREAKKAGKQVFVFKDTTC